MKPSFPKLKQINFKQINFKQLNLKQNLKPYLPRNPVLRDLIVCLIIWLGLELVCTAIASALNVSPVEIRPQQLLALSVLLGIGGACFMAASTQMTLARTVPGISRKRKRILGLMSQVLSWLGLVGIGFPLLSLSFWLALWVMSPLRA
ncbi:hypothetical protein [Leptolyngbya ohadii]|uniref:hypothetical protein n=1 Tax=Leptolyngbya ohadii TaxID=1962290 RepID=UPI000B5A1ECC|nr:hypothetical protein [Leptolyngbya ohadii]